MNKDTKLEYYSRLETDLTKQLNTIDHLLHAIQCAATANKELQLEAVQRVVALILAHEAEVRKEQSNIQAQWIELARLAVREDYRRMYKIANFK